MIKGQGPPPLTARVAGTASSDQDDDQDAKLQALGGDQNALANLIHSCNSQGLKDLRNGDLKSAFDHFKYAEAMLLANQQDSSGTTLLSVTCNNLGCYYKKVGKFHGALSYLRRALKLEMELDVDQMTIAGTHLNLCTVLSKLEKHDKAVQHALCALELMSSRITETSTQVMQDDYAVLSIAYHHVAIEREFLEQWDQAATAFQTGYQIAHRLLGIDHPLSVNLGRNCEAVLKKAKQAAEAKSGMGRGSRISEETDEPKDGLKLPPIAGAAPASGGGGAQGAGRDSGELSPGGARAVAPRVSYQRETLDWQKMEEGLWVSFAMRSIAENSGRQSPDDQSMDGWLASSPPDTADTEFSKMQRRDSQIGGIVDDTTFLKPFAKNALLELRRTQPRALKPEASDMGIFRFQRPPQNKLVPTTRFIQDLENNPEALMDIIDEGGRKNTMRDGRTDYRPNRSMHRSSRTGRLVRRTGVFNSTHNRDRVAEELAKRAAKANQPWTSPHVQKLAAERIQSVWRSWYQYCQQNSEWMTITWICATMIQSHWRSYHVRRRRLDKYASIIQRHARGALVRSVLKKHTAAVSIQRHAVGMLTRMQLRRLHDAACKMQKITRGGMTRKHYRDLRHWKLGVIIDIQRLVRVWLAQRIASRKREELHHQMTLVYSATAMQRFFRGWKGRQRCDVIRAEQFQFQGQFKAALMIQQCARRRLANRSVGGRRQERYEDMSKAATYMRKIFMGASTRKRYKALKTQFKNVEAEITTIQRYTRGCLCRLKMWREAVRAEEEIWAAVSIQRIWRGYMGRVRWEMAYEHIWRREIAAAVISRHILGWLARLLVSRMRRKIARSTFETGRERYRGAQKIQALARGVIVRKLTRVRRNRRVAAAVAIQRIQRGRALRARLWEQIIEQRATMIQAGIRGFIVRNRKFHLLAKVICIQRAYRRWLRYPTKHRDAKGEKALRRRNKARMIQGVWREFASRKRIKRIKAAEMASANAAGAGRR
jgi:tetratricopeptide (TPR) repeat protein